MRFRDLDTDPGGWVRYKGFVIGRVINNGTVFIKRWKSNVHLLYAGPDGSSICFQDTVAALRKVYPNLKRIIVEDTYTKKRYTLPFDVLVEAAKDRRNIIYKGPQWGSQVAIAGNLFDPPITLAGVYK